jgi:hypothetical protein
MKTFLKYICNALEILCCITHPFVEFEVLLTKKHCNLAHLSLLLNDKYDLGIWKKSKQEKTYYENYPGL